MGLSRHLYFQGNVLMCRIVQTRRQFAKDVIRDMNGTLFSLRCLRATCKNGWKSEKNTADSGTSGHFAGALYHVDAPRDFGPRFAYASWRWFRAALRYLVPDKAVRERKAGP